ncbi:MAG TPA: CRISPR-associated protein Csx19 [Bacillota bacterium]|jgi:hypothetical protein|nr:CRISPR-associated protein Csx19 [Bacillota bacterium]
MGEIALKGFTDDIRQFLEESHFPGSSWVLLEREDDWFQEKDQEKIFLGTLDKWFNTEDWAKGRVFCQVAEVRWHYSNGGYQVIFTGNGHNASSLKSAEINLTDCIVRDTNYLLWGERLRNPGEYGIESEDSVFLEIQIPRLLFYPVPESTDRVWLHVREFISKETGLLIHSRWLDLGKEVRDPS